MVFFISGLATEKAPTKRRQNILKQRQRLSLLIIATLCDRLEMALKLSLLNGFKYNKLRYHAHACPEAVCLPIVDKG